MTYKTYNSKMKNIRNIVIFDDNEHILYIYDLELNKVIEVQQSKNLYQVNKYRFSFHKKIDILIMKEKSKNF
jgi:hypothetical protein